MVFVREKVGISSGGLIGIRFYQEGFNRDCGVEQLAVIRFLKTCEKWGEWRI